MPDVDWPEYIRSRKVGYDNEVVMKGLPVSWAQIEPGLPPEALGGSIDSCALASEPVRA